MKVTAYAPGTTANVGPGFDCFGIALTGRGDTVTATRVKEPGVRVTAISDPRIPTEAARNTAAIAAASVLKRAGAEDVGLELSIEKGLPLSGGMGGSAASAVAGAMAANALLEHPLATLGLLEAALDAEAVVAGRHADNVAPSLMGGAVVVVNVHPLAVARIQVHPRLRMVLVTPAYEVETRKAREALPEMVPRHDAIDQAASLGGLIIGLERGDAALLRASAMDRIAEPGRRPLYPGWPEAKQAGLEAGAFAVVVSGAGPTILGITDEATAPAVQAAMEKAYLAAGSYRSQGYIASVDNEGARIV